MMTTLTWLHLSDWHQKGPEFDRQVVRDALLKDIRERADRISSDLAAVDFVAFSGDIAFSGQPAEYETARRELLDPLLSILDLTPERLFLAPGNHDLSRTHIYEMLPPPLQNPLDTDAAVEPWLTDAKKRARLLEPFEAYSAFVSGYTGQSSPEYASIRTWTCGSKCVALLGLNSAWMCARHKDDKGEVDDARYILVGEPQVYDALAQIEDADVRIAVLHHPFDWLAPFDRNHVEAHLGRACHFILHGHEHTPKVQELRTTEGNRVIVPAGASFERRQAEAPRYTNAYNWVHLDLEAGQGAVYLRRWSDPRNEWIEDTDAHPSGRFLLSPLPKDLGPKPASSSLSPLVTPSPAPVQPPPPPHFEHERIVLEGYLNALVRNNTDLEPGGIKQTKVQVILPLDEIYVGLQADRDRPDVDRRVMQEELDEIKKRLEREEDPKEREKQYQIWASQARTLQQALEISGPREDLSSIVQRHRQVVILGEPGSGKTTLVRYLTLRFARAILAEPERIFQPQKLWDEKTVWRLPDLGPVRLPILLRISHYAEARQKDPDLSLVDYLPRYFEGLQVPHADELGPLLQRLLEEGRCMVLLDGLDEIIDPTDRRNIATAIGQFAGVYRETGLPDWLARLLAFVPARAEEKPEAHAESEDEEAEIIIPWDKNVPEDVRQEWGKQIRQRQKGWRRRGRAVRLAWELLGEARYAHVGNRFVVTSRIAGYHFAGVPGEFEHYTIRRMSLDDIKLFLEKWCPAVERRIAEAPDPLQVEQRARREIEGILQAVETTPGVRRMAENPLLLRILAIIHRNEAHLPQRRVELYETATVTLLRDWHLERGTPKEAVVDDVKAMSLLGPVAFYIHENRASGFLSKGETERILGGILARERGEKDPEQPSLETREAVHHFLETVREHSGLFVERGEGLYGFMHLTFEEYFTARQLVSSSTRARTQILERLHLPRWREPILLAVGSLSKQFYDDTHDLLRAILEAGSAYEGMLHRDLLFAAACVGDSVNVALVLRQEIAGRLLALYCDRRRAGRYRLLQQQVKDALLALCNDQGDAAVEAALAEMLACCADRAALTCALDAVDWLKARTPAVARALAAHSDLGALPRAQDLLRGVQARLPVNSNGTRPAPAGWDAVRDDPALARLLGAMVQYKEQTGIANIAELLGSSIPDEAGNPLSVGMEVILGRHRPVDGEENWNDNMTAFVGRRAHVTELRGRDSQHCWGVRVDVDNSRWFWRVRDLRIVKPDGQEVSEEIYTERVLNQPDTPDTIEAVGRQVLASANNFGALAPLFAARAAHLIPLQPPPDDDALRANVQAIQADLADALLDTLRHAADPQRYSDAALFLAHTGEGKPRDDAVAIVLADLEGADAARRLALQVLTERAFRERVQFTDARRALLLGLLDAPADQATPALDILFALGFTPDLLAWCWAVLRRPDHPLADAVREQLDGVKKVKGDRPTLALLDEGLRDDALRPSALELLRTVSLPKTDEMTRLLGRLGKSLGQQQNRSVELQNAETSAQALAWLSGEDTEVRHLAALLLAGEDDLLAIPRSVLVREAQERLRATGTSWAALREDARLARLLGGLWLHGWDDALTQLWVAQPAVPYVDKHPSKYWRNFRTYPESEECIRWLLEKAEFGHTLLPTFQEAAARLAELEGDAAQGAPQGVHIAAIQQEMTRQIDELLAQPATPPLLRAEAAIFAAAIHKETIPPVSAETVQAALSGTDESEGWVALSRLAKQTELVPWLHAQCAPASDHPLTVWLRQTLAAHDLAPDAPPAALARLLTADDPDTRASASLALLAADLPALLVAALVETTQSPDDRVRMRGEQRLYSVCGRLPTDGSTGAVETLLRFYQDADARKDGHLGTVLFSAAAKVTHSQPFWVAHWLDALGEKGPARESARQGLSVVDKVSAEVLSLLYTALRDHVRPLTACRAVAGTLGEIIRNNANQRADAAIHTALTTALDDPDTDIRCTAAYALQWTAGQGAWPVAQALLHAAQSDPDAEARILALRSAGRVLHAVRGFRDVDISKEALFRWLESWREERSSFGRDDITEAVKKLPDLSVLKETPDADAVLDVLAHSDSLGLPEEIAVRLRGSDEWDALVKGASQEWENRHYWLETLPHLPAAIAQVEALLAAPEPETRRAAACALARLYHGDDDRPARLRDLLPDDTALLHALLDAATDRDGWGDESESGVSHHLWAVKQIVGWVEARPPEERTRLIDGMLDDLERAMVGMEEENIEKCDIIDDEPWCLRRILVAVLAELSERLTYRAFTRTRDLADVVVIFVRAATDPDSLTTRRFAIRALGNLQQLTAQVADVFFAACQDVGHVYRETRTAVSKFKVFGPGSLERLTVAIRSASITVAYHAALLLGELGVSRSEDLGRAGRQRVADELVQLLDDPLARRIVYDFSEDSDGTRVGPLYDVIYEALVRVVAGPDAPVVATEPAQSG